MSAPGYWLHETSGVLRPVVLAYLDGCELSAPQCAVMRAYLRQWAMASAFVGPMIEGLRQSVNHLHSRAAIRAWLETAICAGIDPL